MLAPLHGSCIKSADGVGRVESSLTQLHSVLVKIALSMIRVVNIFHHIAVNGPVNHFAFGADCSRFLLAGGDALLTLFALRLILAVYLVAVRVPAFQITGIICTGEQRQQNGQP